MTGPIKILSSTINSTSLNDLQWSVLQLTSSQTFQTLKTNEFPKKIFFQYEFSQRKRDEKNRLRLKEKEHRFDGNLRKETWIHPEDGCRVHRTAPLDPSMIGRNADSSDDEELRQMDPSELNKRFVISFLHVQGKLITRIG